MKRNLAFILMLHFLILFVVVDKTVFRCLSPSFSAHPLVLRSSTSSSDEKHIALVPQLVEKRLPFMFLCCRETSSVHVSML